MELYFSDVFEVDPTILEEYGAFDISLHADLPLFIDPFLLFNSDKDEYQTLHEGMIEYLRFLRDKAARGGISKGLLQAWYTFSEVSQNWLGYSVTGNRGSGLGPSFARALNANLQTVFANFGSERVTKGSHLEKLTLIERGVGRDNISDFCTNLIKDYLLRYTEVFAQRHIRPSLRRSVPVQRVRFNYSTETWESGQFDLPWDGTDFVLLTPKDILTKDETWINRAGMFRRFDDVLHSIPNEQLRDQLNNYFRSRLPKDPKKEDTERAIDATVREHPQVIEYYIRYQEDHGDQAVAFSSRMVRESQEMYVAHVKELVASLQATTAFYFLKGDTLAEARQRVLFLKDIIENKGGHRLFYADGVPIRRESDLQILYRLTWFATPSDVSREVNNGRGPVDFKISRGSLDKTLVEFKLASNPRLRRNLEKQLEVYQAASDARKGLKVITYFTDGEREKVMKILKELGLLEDENIILIDARSDNKPSGSRA